LIDKKTVFVLGAGASCPYGYPSGARLRELICFDGGFRHSYFNYLGRSQFGQSTTDTKRKEVQQFIKVFGDSHLKSIDVFMANNPKLAPVGKYIVAYEMLRAEERSCFAEDAKRRQEHLKDCQRSPDKRRYLWSTAGFEGGDWYFYIYNRLVEGLVGENALPNFSDGNLAFVTFNYDRSLEKFFYDSLRNSYQNPELIEAQDILKHADEIFFLGFGYAEENMKVLGLPGTIPPKCRVYGTAFNLTGEEAERIESAIDRERTKAEDYFDARPIKIESGVDCLMLLRKYLSLS